MTSANWIPNSNSLTRSQQAVVDFARQETGSLAVRGLPGTGKTTALLACLQTLLHDGHSPYRILVLVPQRAQVGLFERALATLQAPTRGGVDIVTYYGLCRRAVALFWPVIAAEAGFAHPEREPVFLTIETAQYYMWRIVEPLMRTQGYFSDLRIRRSRLLSQLIDNLNKSALVGFDHQQIYHRLQRAWTGAEEHLYRFRQAQDCANRFRSYCLEHNLLDFSLTTEVFDRHLRNSELFENYIAARYRYLIVDNLEENVPVAHDFIGWTMARVDTTILVLDRGGGHRYFLGADPQSAEALAARCDRALAFDTPLEPTQHTLAWVDRVARALGVSQPPIAPDGDPRRAISGHAIREDPYWIEMIHWAVDKALELIESGTPPGQIAFLAPYVSEIMHFVVQEALAQHGVAVRALRPARPLGDDPIIRGLLFLAVLAHPEWQLEIQGQAYQITSEQVALALETALGGLDPVRARDLANLAWDPEHRRLRDLSGDSSPNPTARDVARMWERVGYQIRPQYERLRQWLENAQQRSETEALDIFISRLFATLLSQPDYAFYRDSERGRSAGRLVESANKFRVAVGQEREAAQGDLAREYVQLVLGGIASAAYIEDEAVADEEGIVLAPAYTYLTRNLRSRYQFWLDLGSDGWYTRPNQPLTHPYVLSRYWPLDKPWREIEEENARRQALLRVLYGLAARCSGGIYLAASRLGLDGTEQEGRLLKAALVAMTRMRNPGD